MIEYIRRLIFGFCRLVLDLFNIFTFGLVFSLLWQWFIVDTYNLMEISIPTAMGIVIMFRLLNIKVNDEDPEDIDFDQVIANVLTQAFVYPSIFLLLGLIISFFI